MSEMSKLFRIENFKVRAYEVGPRGRATIQSICNYLQESAANHAEALNVSVSRLIKMNLTWVLSRLHVRMEKYPFWQKTVTVETWPSARDNFYALRDFRIKNEKGEVIGVATSSWMMIDIKARKPVILPEFLKEFENKDEGRTLEDSFKRLPKIGQAQFEKNFNVRLSDLDMNQHVNSVNYIEWGLEVTPPAFWKKYILYDLEISFRAESVYGDRIVSQCRVEDMGDHQMLVHRLLRAQDERELTRMVTRWK